MPYATLVWFFPGRDQRNFKKLFEKRAIRGCPEKGQNSPAYCHVVAPNVPSQTLFYSNPCDNVRASLFVSDTAYEKASTEIVD